MTEFNIGDKVYLANFQSQTGVIESRIERTNVYKVRLDTDSRLLVDVVFTDMLLVE